MHEECVVDCRAGQSSLQPQFVGEFGRFLVEFVLPQVLLLLEALVTGRFFNGFAESIELIDATRFIGGQFLEPVEVGS